MSKRRTTKQFKQDIYNLVGDEYTVLGRYKNAKTKILMRHNTCGFEWSVMPTSIINMGSRCPECAKVKLRNKFGKSQSDFEREVYDLVEDEYTVLGQYKNAKTKILIKHNECGFEWEVLPWQFINSGSRCPKCASEEMGLKLSKNQKEFEKQLKDKFGSQHEVLGEYINAKTEIKIKHKKCGTIWKTTPNSIFASKIGCPKCSLVKKTHKEFVIQLKKQVDEAYSILGRYKTAKTKIKLRHNKCGHIWIVSPSQFLQGSRCPKCNTESSGERFIRKFLCKYNIEYKSQYSFNDCFDVNALRFDFAVFPNKKIIVLIEYDGKQHFEPIEYFGGEEALINTQRKDKIKNRYCKENNIPLLRIPYWEKDNINIILAEYLSKFTDMKGVI